MLGRDKASPQRPLQQFGWADTEAARQFVKSRQAEKKEVGNAVINRSLALLRRMLNLAKDEGRIPCLRFLDENALRSDPVQITTERDSEQHRQNHSDKQN